MNSVLVLNSDYTPINITSSKRGVTLLYKGKAEIIKNSGDIIYSNSQVFYRPLIIRLTSYVKYKFRRLRVNRHRIMRRDNYSCVYCGNKKNLTIDHIIPKSKGGTNTWSNLVACCSPCNLKKGDKLLHESGLKMVNPPSEPSIFYDSTTNYLKKIYEDYLNTF